MAFSINNIRYENLSGWRNVMEPHFRYREIIPIYLNNVGKYKA